MSAFCRVMLWCAVVWPALLTGCGGPKTVPVNGIVTLDGRPLARATVIFIAQDAAGRDANGFTDAEGRFALMTNAPKDGAMPGSYKIVVHYSEATEPGAQYSNPEDARKAGAKAAAEKGRTKPRLPSKYTDAEQTVLQQQVPVDGPVLIELTSE
jgi:hypothetical protein